MDSSVQVCADGCRGRLRRGTLLDNRCEVCGKWQKNPPLVPTAPAAFVVGTAVRGGRGRGASAVRGARGASRRGGIERPSVARSDTGLVTPSATLNHNHLIPVGPRKSTGAPVSLPGPSWTRQTAPQSPESLSSNHTSTSLTSLVQQCSGFGSATLPYDETRQIDEAADGEERTSGLKRPSTETSENAQKRSRADTTQGQPQDLRSDAGARLTENHHSVVQPQAELRDNRASDCEDGEIRDCVQTEVAKQEDSINNSESSGVDLAMLRTPMPIDKESWLYCELCHTPEHSFHARGHADDPEHFRPVVAWTFIGLCSLPEHPLLTGSNRLMALANDVLALSEMVGKARSWIVQRDRQQTIAVKAQLSVQDRPGHVSRKIVELAQTRLVKLLRKCNCTSAQLLKTYENIAKRLWSAICKAAEILIGTFKAHLQFDGSFDVLSQEQKFCVLRDIEDAIVRIGCVPFGVDQNTIDVVRAQLLDAAETYRQTMAAISAEFDGEHDPATLLLSNTTWARVPYLTYQPFLVEEQGQGHLQQKQIPKICLPHLIKFESV